MYIYVYIIAHMYICICMCLYVYVYDHHVCVYKYSCTISYKGYQAIIELVAFCVDLSLNF